MGTTSQIIDPREVTKAALREVLRSLIHEMAEQAMDGRLRLAQGLAEVEEFAKAYQTRMALLDQLINPPWAHPLRSPEELVKDLEMMQDIDAVLARFVDQAPGDAKPTEKENER